MKYKISLPLLFLSAIALVVTPAFAEEGVAINDHTEGWNTLWRHVLIDIGVIGVLVGAIVVWLLIAYRRQRDDQEGDSPPFTMGRSLAWALIPAFLFLADDFFLAAQGWKLWIDQRTVPENAYEIKTTASMYSWNFVYENGKDIDVYPDSDDTLILPVGRPVVFRSTSEDVIHGFFIPHFRIKEDVMPGRVTFVWIYPREATEYTLVCTEFCGMGHSEMYAKVKTVPEEEFNKWVQEGV